MVNLTIGPSGEIALPAQVRQRYGMMPDTPVRVIETVSGILLVPLTVSPMSPELAAELDEWQALSTQSWELFPYEEGDE